MRLLDTAKWCDFFKFPAQELSNGIVFVNGTQKLASLDFREVCKVVVMTNDSSNHIVHCRNESGYSLFELGGSFNSFEIIWAISHATVLVNFAHNEILNWIV